MITFNHDLLVENIALRLPKGAHGWCLKSLYNDAELSPLYAQGGTDPVFDQHGEHCQHAPPFRLLKLHGSLNWGVRSTTPEPKLGTLFPEGKRKIFMLDRRIYSDRQGMTTSTKRGRKNWYLWPLIVPPIYDKHRVTGMIVLEQLWTAARAAIEACDRLVFVGYSLSETDIVTTQMLRRAFLGNDKLHGVECINPDAQIVSKLKTRLNCRVVKLFQDIPSFLEDHTP